MKLHKHFGNSYTVEGIDGVYRVVMIRTFNRVSFIPKTGNLEFVGSVPAGNYGSPGIKACGNPQAREMIEEKIIAHAKRSGFIQ